MPTTTTSAPTTDRPQTAVATPSSKRRFLSAIASPFANNQRTVAEFSVTVKDEHRQYSPGDIVRGNITIRTTRPTRITHIVVCLHGFVQVYKNPGTPNEDYRPGAARNHRAGNAYGNGFATLFEDEVVLCGDGKLTEGTFRFEFELEFPDRDLPSSIDFERGTITYMVTAALTRPTTISPVIFSERKVYFVERIDVSQLSNPKPKTITLEPVRKRPKPHSQARKLADNAEKSVRGSDSIRHSSIPPPASRTPSVPSTQHTDSVAPASPAPSDVSFDSAFSNARASQQDSQYRLSQAESDSALTSSKVSLTNKIITATVEPECGGCLRGDNISIKINVSHTKHIKSLYGVIVTFYRQARVDMHPTMPVGPTEKGKAARYEDYYPKSVTGLGGLSLSGAGSSHVFRKDLSQTTKPLIIDPNTLSTEINTKVRVPENAFPTIRNVPGTMISFRYYVEVVLDIQGKLSGLERGIPSDIDALPNHVTLSDPSGTEWQSAAPFGSSIIDTFPVRRDRGVVTCAFEIVVGTRDSERSERRRGKRKATDSTTAETNNGSLRNVPQDQSRSQSQNQDHHQNQNQNQNQAHGHDQSQERHQNQHDESTSGEAYTGEDGYWYDPRWYDYSYGYGGYEAYDQNYAQAGGTDGQYDQYYYTHDPAYYNSQGYYPYPHPPQQPPVPLPQMPDESQMSEKERMRQAEMRLLPSQPPGPDGNIEASSASHTIDEASAPYLPSEEGLSAPSAPPWPSGFGYASSNSVITPTAPPAAEGASSAAVPNSSSISSNYAQHPQPSSAIFPAAATAAAPSRARSTSIPQYDSHPQSTSTTTIIAPPTDDKQELQRRALLAEASAPPGVEESVLGSESVAAGAAAVNNHAHDDEGAVVSHEADAHREAAPGTVAGDSAGINGSMTTILPSRPVLSATTSTHDHQPSAPTMQEVEDEAIAGERSTSTTANSEMDSHADAPASSGLPRYER